MFTCWNTRHSSVMVTVNSKFFVLYWRWTAFLNINQRMWISHAAVRWLRRGVAGLSRGGLGSIPGQFAWDWGARSGSETCFSEGCFDFPSSLHCAAFVFQLCLSEGHRGASDRAQFLRCFRFLSSNIALLLALPSFTFQHFIT